MPSVRVGFFDTWRPGYGQAQVSILLANTATLGAVFTDEACTEPATNPQTLAQMTLGDISYGRWLVPLYTNAPFELSIDGVDQTAIVAPPLTSLVGEDASEATVIPTGASQAGNLDDLLARRVDVRDYGIFLAVGTPNASATTNTAALSAAIDAVSAFGGGIVNVPAGTYGFTTLTIPANVVIEGAGQIATILQSTATGAVVTIAGAQAGFAQLTLDGISQVAASVGLFAANVDFIILRDVQIQRFATGVQRYGGSGSYWRDLFVSDCLIGYDAQGNSDNGNGGALTNETWDGGKIELNANVGLQLKYVDSPVAGLTFRDIGFDTNTQQAIAAIGTAGIKLVDCWGSGNGGNFTLSDAAPAVQYNSASDTLGNQLDGFEVEGGRWGPAITPAPASGANTAVAAVNSVNSFTGNLSRVAFRSCEFSYQTNNIFAPVNNILVEDCNELYGMNFGGDTPSAWTTQSTFNNQEAALVTTSNATQVLWQYQPPSGANFFILARIVVRGRNSPIFAVFWVGIYGRHKGAQLNYDQATAQFTLGDTITGNDSGASARVYAISTPTGTLVLGNVSGTFQDAEQIKGAVSGVATVAGITGTDLTFSGATAPFAVDDTITGQTSGATATISSISNTGTSGFLLVQDVIGTFLVSETIAGAESGSAITNSAAVDAGLTLSELFGSSNGNSSVSFTAAFVAANRKVELQVIGANGLTMEWTAAMELTTSVDVTANNIPIN